MGALFHALMFRRTHRVVQLGGGVAPSAAPSPSGPLQLRLVNSFPTLEGNASHLAWSADGSQIYLANNEGYTAVKLTTAPLKVVAQRSGPNAEQFLWSVSRSGNVVVFRNAGGFHNLFRYDPVAWTLLWNVDTGYEGRSVITDGTYIFSPGESPGSGTPGRVFVHDLNGNLLFTTVLAADTWGRVYGMAYNASAKRLYFGVAANAGVGAAGGIYIFDTSPLPSSAPTFLGKFSSGTTYITVAGTRLWRSTANVLECWDVSNPAAAALLGSYTYPVVSTLTRGFDDMIVNAAGTRLYVNFNGIVAGDGAVSTIESGWSIFNVSANTPALVTSRLFPATEVGRGNTYFQTTGIALSVDETKIAVSLPDLGVRTFGVTGDVIADIALALTTGEVHDVYVDAAGFYYVWENDNIQVYNAAGTLLSYFFSSSGGSSSEGGWRPFRSGYLVTPSGRTGNHADVGEEVISCTGGAVTYISSLRFTSGFAGDQPSDLMFEDPYLYCLHNSGKFAVWSVPTLNVGGDTSLILVGQVTTGSPPWERMTKVGNVVWGVHHQYGVTAIDVTNRAAPVVVYTDTVGFPHNGNIVGSGGIVADQGRIYVAAGERGLIVYNPGSNPATTVRSGLVNFGINGPDFLDAQVIGTRHYLLAFVYSGPVNGMYVFDITDTPDSPVQIDFTRPRSSPFRGRAGIGNTMYNTWLGGVQTWQLSV